MPTWLFPILVKAGQFIGQRFIHFLTYVFLAAITIGVPYVLFVKRTTSHKETFTDGATKVEFHVATLPLSCARFDSLKDKKK